MRIASWVSALLLATCASVQAQTPLALPDGGSLAYTTKGNKTRFEIRTQEGRKPYVLLATRDANVAPGAPPAKVEVLGAMPGVALIVADTYASRPGGMSYCQAGEEQFLRVIAIARRPARESLRIKLASCRQNIELASPGVSWAADRATLDLHWLQGPQAGGGEQTRTVKIGAKGQPE